MRRCSAHVAGSERMVSDAVRIARRASAVPRRDTDALHRTSSEAYLVSLKQVATTSGVVGGSERARRRVRSERCSVFLLCFLVLRSFSFFFGTWTCLAQRGVGKVEKKKFLALTRRALILMS